MGVKKKERSVLPPPAESDEGPMVISFCAEPAGASKSKSKKLPDNFEPG